MASIPSDDSARGFWFGLINFEHRAPTPDDFKLDRMRRLLSLLNNPEKDLPVLHIAGSKGKGSTSALLHSALKSSGYKVGLFTSPHLERVEERIRIDNEEITPGELNRHLFMIRETIGYPGCAVLGFIPTFFEVATAAGFLFFNEQNIDLVVMETGLGGRLDATNVCAPIATIITSISFDHEKQLGGTLEEIAEEKAGIIKSHVPVISGAQGVAKEVISRRAKQFMAPLYHLGENISFSYQPGLIGALADVIPRATVRTPWKTWLDLEMPLLGKHQAANLSLAMTALDFLAKNGWDLPEGKVRKGIKETVWFGRMEMVPSSPRIVMDCAHNADSMEQLVLCLNESFPPVHRTIIFGASADKDIPGMFRHIRGNFHEVIFTQSSKSPRAANPEELTKSWLENPGITPRLAPSLKKALEIAKEVTPSDGILCITGSVFLIGEIRAWLGTYPDWGKIDSL